MKGASFLLNDQADVEIWKLILWKNWFWHLSFFSMLFLCSEVLIFQISLFQELSLSGLGLSSVPASVWGADEILKVDLSKNAIEELPNEFSSCSSLQVVNSEFSLFYSHICSGVALSCSCLICRISSSWSNAFQGWVMCVVLSSSLSASCVKYSSLLVASKQC